MKAKAILELSLALAAIFIGLDIAQRLVARFTTPAA
jgi:hypothetical protein